MREIYTYRGGPGMAAWALHRLAGVGVALFLALHIFDIFLVGFGPAVFNELLFLYRAPLFRMAEIFLLFGLLYHALNGLRLVLLELFPATSRFQPQLWYVQMAIFLLAFVPLAILMFIPVVKGVLGSS
jgi:succinate dehydrogenase / fumarate reductase, cytochrome b subunit